MTSIVWNHTTRTLLSLQWVLWKRTVSTSIPTLIGTILVGVLVVGQCVSLGIFSAVLYQDNGDPSGFIFAMALGCAVYLLGALLYPSSETQVEPRHLATLPLSSREVLVGLMLGTFVHSTAFISVVNTLIMAAIGSVVFGGVQAVWWTLACVAQLLITVALGAAVSQALTSIEGTKLQERLAVLTTVVLMGGLVGFMVYLQTTTDASPVDAVSSLLPIIEWTPFAAAAAAGAPATVADGTSAGAILGHGLVALLSVTVAVWLWHRAVRSLIRHPIARSRGGAEITRRAHRTILVPWARPGRFGALYSRALRYWIRDTRQLANMIMLPLMGVAYFFLGMTGEDHYMSWFSLGFVVVASGSFLANNIGMDGPANWVHLAAGVPARAFLWSRWAAGATVMLGWTALIGSALGVLHHFSPLWVVVVGLAVQVMAMNIALGLFCAVLAPSPTAKPKGTLHIQKNNNSAGAAVLMGTFSLAIMVMVVPGIVAYVMLDNAWLGLLIQIPVTVGVVWGIIAMATKRLTSAWPRLFFRVRQWA
ncbi:hypothetical protein F8377_03740 [Corynebacterium zhongnanshanii]|uniref:ABC transporter permease n=1 Tax=Corynebacterium zhongnanshanii TaxID=2768834 RepID=A0ABQ6VFS0_9CORY|nr:hypothetical protein [Corynebacterium zhongnanshanii]KAB3523262.1 hypothetical protein F8377_03740 [Corynebacterium zhongnanshanii]